MFDTLEADIVVMQETKIQRKDLRDDMVLVPGWDVYFSLPKYKKGQQTCSRRSYHTYNVLIMLQDTLALPSIPVLLSAARLEQKKASPVSSARRIHQPSSATFLRTSKLADIHGLTSFLTQSTNKHLTPKGVV